MVGEAIAGLSAFKTMFDMAKALQGIHDTATHDRAVIELQKEILAAQAQQSALVERIGQLEKQLASFEKWEAEKEKYELQEIYPGTFAYAIKTATRGSEPAHLICANCYEHGKKSIFQYADAAHMSCPDCKSRIRANNRPSGNSALFGTTQRG